MSGNQLDFYRARVEQARAEAEAATLEHVRERCRRSQDAWALLAARAEKSENLRNAEAQRKAAQALLTKPDEKKFFDHDNHS
jgi:hypothetical protein